MFSKTLKLNHFNFFFIGIRIYAFSEVKFIALRIELVLG